MRKLVILAVLATLILSACAGNLTAQRTYIISGKVTEVTGLGIKVQADTDTDLAKAGENIRLPIYNPAGYYDIHVGDRVEMSCSSYSNSDNISSCSFKRFLAQ